MLRGIMFNVPQTVVLAILSTCLSICCIGGNLLVLVAFVLDRGVRTANNYFIISLAVTDLTIGLISINLLTLYVLLDYWPLGQWICDIWLSIDFTLCMVSQVTVFMITLDRFISVRFAVRYRNWRTDVKLKWMLSLSWIIPSAWWFTLIFGWYAITGEKRTSGPYCNIPFTHHSTFNTTLTVCYFWIPLLCMISLYIGIYKVAVTLQKKALKSEKGLAELMMMAGSTMSRIGLSVKIKPTSDTIHLSQLTVEKSVYTAAVFAVKPIEQDPNECSKTMLPDTCGFVDCSNLGYDTPKSKQQEFVDSGLDNSNNQRVSRSDLYTGYDQPVHYNSNSSFAVETLRHSELYKDIQSPTAPSSDTSSLYAESQGPWLHKKDTTFTFKDMDRFDEASSVFIH